MKGSEEALGSADGEENPHLLDLVLSSFGQTPTRSGENVAMRGPTPEILLKCGT
jgi:hypothetical protein